MTEHTEDEQEREYERIMVEHYGQEAWDRYVAYENEMAKRHERECGASIDFGPAHDLYQATCDRDKGHDDLHEGDDPMGVAGARMAWTRSGRINRINQFAEEGAR